MIHFTALNSESHWVSSFVQYAERIWEFFSDQHRKRIDTITETLTHSFIVYDLRCFADDWMQSQSEEKENDQKHSVKIFKVEEVRMSWHKTDITRRTISANLLCAESSD